VGRTDRAGQRAAAHAAGGGNAYPTNCGQAHPNKEAFDQRGQKLLTDWAVWDAYKLVQPRPTASPSRNAPIRKAAGWPRLPDGALPGCLYRRRLGRRGRRREELLAVLPGVARVQKASGDAADLYVWLWSPDAAAMDLRHYDTRAHGLDSSYEDVQPGFSTPHGVARSSEMTLSPAPVSGQ